METVDRTTRACARCGATTATDAPDGICPRCFLESAVASDPAAPPAGADRLAEELPRYEVLQEEGNGFFRARDKETGRVVALRIFREPVASFLTRAAALARTEHAHLPRVHDHGEKLGLRYVVTDYAEGRRLSEMKLRPREALRIVEQVCGALGRAWDEGVPLDASADDAIRVDGQGHARIARITFADGKPDMEALAEVLHTALAGETPPDPKPRTMRVPLVRMSRDMATDRPSQLAAAAGAAIVLIGFLPWAGFSTGTLSAWWNGWEASIQRNGTSILPSWLLLIAGIVLGTLAVGRWFQLIELPWKTFAIGGALGALGVAIWAILVLSLDPGPDASVSLGPGAPLAFLAFLCIFIAGRRMGPSPRKPAPPGHWRTLAQLRKRG